MNADWRKSSYSSGEGNCVEVAHDPGAIAVRDSKNPGNGHLTLTPAEWQTFTAKIKAGRLG
ncbi:MAG TPA: DUF397 domain-containing protein [Streptosporangiaceae bacterium]|nr:DUF397 domain-containing protein [Streptosporangiaceae bacterium]